MGSRGASANTGKSYGVRSSYITGEIKKLATQYKNDEITDNDVQDILEGYEFTRGENYENMRNYFESQVADIRSGGKNSRIIEAKKELKTVQKQYSEAAKALRYTESARDEFERLSKRRNELLTIINKPFEG